MIPFRLMYPHIGSLIGLFRLCGYCSETLLHFHEYSDRLQISLTIHKCQHV